MYELKTYDQMVCIKHKLTTIIQNVYVSWVKT